MATKEQLDRIERMLSGVEASIRKAFQEFLASLNSQQVFSAIEGYLSANDVAGALSIMDSYIANMGVVLTHSIAEVGIATAAQFNIPDTIISIYFDPAHPRAAAMTRRNTMEFIREFSDEQRGATRQAISRAFEQGTGTAGTARAFRDSIGLTKKQDDAVENYRRLLMRANNGSTAALTRTLRDRRYDRSVEAAAQGKRILSDDQINLMVDRYRKRYLDYRSNIIARTEGVRATSLAREESLRQMVEQTGIDPSTVKRIWYATRDDRTRDFHASMQGQKRGIDETFEDGLGNSLLYPGDATAEPETVINCRCTISFEIG